MKSYAERIESLDLGLFESIPTQTSADDRRALLLLQNRVRQFPGYVYLEIGSHLGGSIQPHYVDPACRMIYSIDKRPLIQPDERGKSYEYVDNSSARMMSNLKEAFGVEGANKIQIFDRDASEVDPSSIMEKPVYCFIDGEHTNSAVMNDFHFCARVCQPDAMIAFHDTHTVYQGILEIKRQLGEQGRKFEGLMLPGSVYVILLDGAIERHGEALRVYAQDQQVYFRHARSFLWQTKLKHRCPPLFRLLMLVKKMLGRA